MKRIIGIVAFLLLLLMTTICSAEDAKPYTVSVDMDNITISGKLAVWKDTEISLLVVNTGKSISELNGSNMTDIIAYEDQTTVADDGSFKFDFAIKGEQGQYAFYIEASGYNLSISDAFKYYGSGYLVGVLNDIDTAKLTNDAAAVRTILKTEYSKIGSAATIYDAYLAAGQNIDELYIVVSKMKAVNKSVPELVRQLNTAAVLAQIKCAASGEDVYQIITNDSYKSFLNLENYSPYNTYTDATILTQAQQYAIGDGLKGVEFIDAEDFKIKFQTDVILAAANTAASYGELGRVLTSNQAIIGFTRMAEYTKLGKKKDNVFVKLYGKTFASLIDIRDKFDDAVIAVAAEINQGGGGSGGFGGGSGGGSVIGNVQEEKPIFVPADFDDLTGFEWAQESIVKLREMKIVDGVGNGKFLPDKNVNREEFTKMIVVTFGLYDPNAKVDFDDVSEDSWAYQYIASAVKSGIVEGNGENSFGMGESITREDMAAIVYRALNKMGYIADEEYTQSVFSDAQEISGYANQAVNALNSAGIVSGMGNGEFRPKEYSNRAQAAVVIDRALEFIDVL